ncbi:hypothetical protein GBAR_LOCUS28101 [Geodia barretti]|uniref:Uncharacterized protein n=1 Tax=Geodia barretti TaxID=519541 RepID=A0AA35TN21_GEOBA|nr:hypothetical protein GBAR_LOCUS28101 [Geodia barretti]
MRDPHWRTQRHYGRVLHHRHGGKMTHPKESPTTSSLPSSTSSLPLTTPLRRPPAPREVPPTPETPQPKPSPFLQTTSTHALSLISHLSQTHTPFI